MSSKTWFVTSTSRGFGREWSLPALERGDSVVATARSIADRHPVFVASVADVSS